MTTAHTTVWPFVVAIAIGVALSRASVAVARRWGRGWGVALWFVGVGCAVFGCLWFLVHLTLAVFLPA